MLCHRSPASRDRGLLFSHPRLIVGRDYLLCIDAHTSTLNLVIPFSVDKQRIRSISTMVLVLNLVLNLVLYLYGSHASRLHPHCHACIIRALQLSRLQIVVGLQIVLFGDLL